MTMAEPLYQVNIEKKLLDLGDQLEYEVEQYAALTVERAEAESEYKRQYHRAILRLSEGTVAKKEAIAHLKAANAYHAWKISEAQEKATQQKLIALRTQIESARTISANVRASGG
mgnify:CR=1 FL=1